MEYGIIMKVDSRIRDTIDKLNKNLEELNSQKGLILQDLNSTRERNKKIQSEIRESFWGDFLIGLL